MFLHADSNDSDQTEALLGAHSFCWFCHVMAQTHGTVIRNSSANSVNQTSDVCKV